MYQKPNLKNIYTVMIENMTKKDFTFRISELLSMLRDIAARNCLVTDDGVVKIFDFWMTERGERYQIRNGEKIPIKWAAPEVILAGNKLKLLKSLVATSLF